jgi:hypothetical protein
VQVVVLAAVWAFVLGGAALRWVRQERDSVRAFESRMNAWRDATPVLSHVRDLSATVRRKRRTLGVLCIGTFGACSAALVLQDKASIASAAGATDVLVLYVTVLATHGQRRDRAARLARRRTVPVVPQPLHGLTTRGLTTRG